MTWHVAFDGVAEAELEEALRWYRDRDPTLPGRMLEATQAAVAAIARRPHGHPPVHGLPTTLTVRQARLRRFPYALVFVLTDESSARVIAVAHLRRRPLYWASRL